MDDLTYSLRQLCQRNRDGSYTTQADRMRSLSLAARQLREAGFRQMKASSLKGKSAHLRWWARRSARPASLPADNTQLGVAERRYVTNVSKAQELGTGLEQVTDAHVRMSLQLQAAFGLRREEAIKFQPSYADRATTSPSRDRGPRAVGSELCPSQRQSNARRSTQHTAWRAQDH